MATENRRRELPFLDTVRVHSENKFLDETIQTTTTTKLQKCIPTKTRKLCMKSKSIKKKRMLAILYPTKQK